MSYGWGAHPDSRRLVIRLSGEQGSSSPIVVLPYVAQLHPAAATEHDHSRWYEASMRQIFSNFALKK